MTKKYKESNKINEILEINREQKIFYNSPRDFKNRNIIMKIWSKARSPMYWLLWNSGIWENVFKEQLEWIGNLGNKRVLDFGCYSGNDLSMLLAEKSCYYLGIDLSLVAIDKLKNKLESKNIKNANAKTIDILSPEFKEKDFDIIYAQGVIHHFKHIDVILSVLDSKLKKGGLIITIDPMQTAITSRIIRTFYHPFRHDKEWEFPFRKNTFKRIEKYYDIVAVQGFMGYSKWSIPVAYINKHSALKLTGYLHKKDLEKANNIGPGLWKCLQISMCLAKKNI